MGSSSKTNIRLREPIFCSACGTKTDWVVSEKHGKEVEICPKCGKVHFRNSKPCAGALIVENGKILLVKRAIEPFFGYWDIPGGFLNENEHPADGAIRETLEETGLNVEPLAFFGIFIDYYEGEGGGFTHNTYYIVKPIGGALSAGDDASEAKWFSFDSLPENIAFPNHAKKVLRLLIEKFPTKSDSMKER